MNCCRYNCVYLSVIVAILAGIALGVLYALGFVATGVIFWAYVLTGILALLLLPVYLAAASDGVECLCVCRYRGLVAGTSVAAIVTAIVGLIVAPVAPIVAVSVVLGVATFAVTFLLGTVVCLSGCYCRD